MFLQSHAEHISQVQRQSGVFALLMGRHRRGDEGEEREMKGTRKKAYLQSSLEKSGEKRRMEVRLEVLIQRGGGREEGERNRVEERGND